MQAASTKHLKVNNSNDTKEVKKHDNSLPACLLLRQLDTAETRREGSDAAEGCFCKGVVR